MLNYIKTDLFRTLTRVSFCVQLLALIALPAIIITGVKAAYPPEMVTSITPGIVYMAFSLVALLVSDYTFREDMQLGLYKNDTTNGVSRAGIYMAKFMAGALLMAAMWLSCSAACVLATGANYGWDNGAALFANMASMTALSWFLQTLLFLALFQALGVVIKKTVALLGVCVLASAAVTHAGNVLSSALPGIADFLNMDVSDAFGDLPVAVLLKSLVITMAGIALLLLAGSALFGRKEL
jgi:ABC-type transport system involved in cytochrome c biogenesis permease component